MTAILSAIIASLVLSIRAAASEEFVVSGHALVVVIPEGWERRTEIHAPFLAAINEKATGNSFALMGMRQPDEKFTLNRKGAEVGLVKGLGTNGKILRRTEAKLLGLPAYCFITESEIQGQKSSGVTIMAEKALNGFVYMVQCTKAGGGDLDDASVQAIADRVHLKNTK